MGQDAEFTVSSEARPCTQGVDLSSRVMTLQELGVSSPTTGTCASVPEPVMAFADVEGQVSSPAFPWHVALYCYRRCHVTTFVLHQLH
jgi:hypothetical protein